MGILESNEYVPFKSLALSTGVPMVLETALEATMAAAIAKRS
jgi:hypothetical protein